MVSSLIWCSVGILFLSDTCGAVSLTAHVVVNASKGVVLVPPILFSSVVLRVSLAGSLPPCGEGEICPAVLTQLSNRNHSPLSCFFSYSAVLVFLNVALFRKVGSKMVKSDKDFKNNILESGKLDMQIKVIAPVRKLNQIKF